MLPLSKQLTQYESLAEPIFQQVTNLVAQNDRLIAARDLLLPKLMSGEILV